MPDLTPNSPEPVATGNRRETMHYEADPNQLVRMRASDKPHAPMPPDVPTSRADEPLRSSAAPPVEDVAVVPEEPSVWDARPPEE